MNCVRTRGEEPPRLYGVINGLLRMRNGLRRSQELDDLVDVLARPRRTRHPHDERLRFPPRPGQPDDVTPWIGYNVLDSPMRDE